MIKRKIYFEDLNDKVQNEIFNEVKDKMVEDKNYGSGNDSDIVIDTKVTEDADDYINRNNVGWLIEI